ncbi:MAG: nucleoside-diphosphate kinase [Candidatus Terrybacteria bacterium RIFCSPHIGHO2_01_FULL_48_17]|uniref:nucleoside-diphosphate kinase n=1 Tax=Candidatus Terrybacteria bacterium RIFCSPHIGHO2_01_FULL_48_17 TaxID=1802362 RepID=A0A1G2PKQ2_9BACT|nr:MAG: nucleoside-diphosphate kinase [Candidatus Terrybacteria bacterium RIFCSPHIGHO2_01_FULL_48_17]OHA52861.1 MAG: nucleoside-diphosphate kinase [Candidatus Terrybacteria bacterium RIFCSPLOWO2_01_FULL_48_14]
MTTHPKEEKTLLIIKPDAVRRGLIGEIIKRVEVRGLKIVALRMFWAKPEDMDRHYPKDQTWIRRLGEKTLTTYEKYGYDAKKELGTTDVLEIGTQVRGWLISFMTAGPLVKMIVQGVHAVDMVRKLVGQTMPAMAEMGTIRGDYSVDSAAAANQDKRAVRNLVHASETPDEAANEIGLWFSKNEIFEYPRSDEDAIW